MTIARLRTILDAYGAAASRWPEEEREAALALIAQSPEARAAVAGAAALDATLASYANPAENAVNPLKLVAAITAQPQHGQPRHEQPQRPQSSPAAAGRITIGWPNFAGLAAAAIAGFLIGWSGIDQRVLLGPPPGDTPQTLFGDPPEDWTW
jgi:hypothetical protein